MLDGMSDSIQGSRIENLHSREVDRQSPTGLIFVFVFLIFKRTNTSISQRSSFQCISAMLWTRKGQIRALVNVLVVQQLTYPIFN